MRPLTLALAGLALGGIVQAQVGSPPDSAIQGGTEPVGRTNASQDLAATARALIVRGRDDPRLFHQALTVFDRAITAAPEDLDLQVELGDFFLSKYNGQDARETYERVLAEDPEHPGALLGLAQVQRFDGATDVFEITTKILDKDPDHVGTRLLQARQFLDLEDFAAAEREAERSLLSLTSQTQSTEVNAQQAQARALLAASALLGGDRSEAQSRLDQLTAGAADDPVPFVTLAEIAARHRLYSQAVDFADRAITIDAKSWRGFALRGINRLRIGEIETGREDLEQAFAGDPFDVWTKNTLDLLDTLEEYRTVRTERFQLVLPPEEADLLSLYFGPLAEEAFERLTAIYGVAPSLPIRLEVFQRHADFSVRTIGLAGLGALGVCFGPVIAMDAPSARPAGEIHWGTVLWHELAHAFHMQASAGRVPRWFTEGLAVFEERRARPGWGDRVDPDYLIAYQQDRLAPIEDLNQGFMRPAYPQQIAFSYLQSSLLFDFIVAQWGEEAVVAMLAGYRQGANTPEVVRSVLDLELPELAESFDQYFRRRFAGPLAAIRPDDRDRSGSPESADPDDFLAQLAIGRALLSTDPTAAQSHLERARDLFPEYAGADSPYLWLAELHQKAERPAQAAAELEALTAHNQAHYPALRALAEVRTELGDTEGTTEALAALQYIYPYEAADHRQLAEGLEATGRLADAVRARQAVLALEPFDRAQALYHLARTQLAVGSSAAARAHLLEALELAPSHNEALELLLELRAYRSEEP